MLMVEISSQVRMKKLCCSGEIGHIIFVLLSHQTQFGVEMLIWDGRSTITNDLVAIWPMGRRATPSFSLPLCSKASKGGYVMRIRHP